MSLNAKMPIIVSKGFFCMQKKCCLYHIQTIAGACGRTEGRFAYEKKRILYRPDTAQAARGQIVRGRFGITSRNVTLRLRQSGQKMTVFELSSRTFPVLPLSAGGSSGSRIAAHPWIAQRHCSILAERSRLARKPK
jgi:hypothetical protein